MRSLLGDLFECEPVMVFITIIAVACGAEVTHVIATASASVANPPVNNVAAPAADDLGVVVTNETSGNIAVFGGGMGGATVPPGRSCVVPFPQGWAWLTVRVVQMNSEGDFFDPESRLYKTDEMGAWRVKRRGF